MRLWHYKLLSGLPKQQLIGQLRECVCIAKSIHDKGTPNHILVNRIMDYDLQDFRDYCNMVIYNMVLREYNISERTINKLEDYIDFSFDSEVVKHKIFENWHDIRYMNQCIFNLEEKYDCGGISSEEYDKIRDCYRDYIRRVE